MTEDLPNPPSRTMSLVLRADAFLTSTLGVIALTAVLLALVFTGSGLGIGAAIALFVVCCCVGYVGRRQQRLSGRTPRAGDR